MTGVTGIDFMSIQGLSIFDKLWKDFKFELQLFMGTIATNYIFFAHVNIKFFHSFSHLIIPEWT